MLLLLKGVLLLLLQVAVEKNDILDAGDLVVFIDTKAGPAEDPLSDIDSDSDEAERAEAGSSGKQPALAA